MQVAVRTGERPGLFQLELLELFASDVGRAYHADGAC